MLSRKSKVKLLKTPEAFFSFLFLHELEEFQCVPCVVCVFVVCVCECVRECACVRACVSEFVYVCVCANLSFGRKQEPLWGWSVGSQSAMLVEDFAEVATCLKKLVAWNVHEGRFGKCYCDKCKASSSPWRCLLTGNLMRFNMICWLTCVILYRAIKFNIRWHICTTGLEPKLAEAKQKVAEDVLFFDHMLRHTYGEALAAQTCL